MFSLKLEYFPTPPVLGCTSETWQTSKCHVNWKLLRRLDTGTPWSYLTFQLQYLMKNKQACSCLHLSAHLFETWSSCHSFISRYLCICLLLHKYIPPYFTSLHLLDLQPSLGIEAWPQTEIRAPANNIFPRTLQNGWRFEVARCKGKKLCLLSVILTKWKNWWKGESECLISHRRCLVFLHHYTSISAAFTDYIVRPFCTAKATSHICPFEDLSAVSGATQCPHSSTLVLSVESPIQHFTFTCSRHEVTFFGITQDLTGHRNPKLQSLRGFIIWWSVRCRGLCWVRPLPLASSCLSTAVQLKSEAYD